MVRNSQNIIDYIDILTYNKLKISVKISFQINILTVDKEVYVMLLDLLAIGAGVLLNEFAYIDGYGYDSGNGKKDDFSIPYTCTNEWRSINPWGYNPVTGGWTEEEDHQNGW